MKRTDILTRRLEHTENLRDSGKNWAIAVYGVVRLFPAEEEKKIKAFITRKQGENIKELLDYIENIESELDKTPNTPAKNAKKDDELMSKMQIVAKLRAFVASVDQHVAQLDIETAAELLDYEWEILTRMMEDE